ncbi:MAG: fatty acid desaturase [Cyanobacteria bacterium P01_G01_bin.39]
MNQSYTLPPALLPDSKSKLSEQAKIEIRELHGAQPASFLTQAFRAWTWIIAAIALAIYANNIWATLIAIIFIATRFNVFIVLIHEQAHCVGLKGKYGNLIVNLLVGYPLLFSMFSTVENYAAMHSEHHKNYFTDKDPDFLRKSGVDWTFPMTSFHIIKLLLRDLFGFTSIQLILGKPMQNQSTVNRPCNYPKWIKFVYYIAIAALLTYTNMWSVFFIYWLVPLLTVFPAIVRFGAITEHVYNLPEADMIESSPLIVLNWWEQLLLPELNFTFHPYHHLYPGIACFNLPKVHQIFEQEQLVNKTNVFYGYWSYFKYLQKHSVKNTLVEQTES